MNLNDMFSKIRSAIGDEKFTEVMRRVNVRLNYSPVIVFMGKTGVGKSSLCNALFGKDLFKIDDVAACTRKIQVEERYFQDGSLTLVDVPGIGEDLSKSQEYNDLYRNILQNGVFNEKTKKNHPVDVIVWLIKADDRALEVEGTFYQSVFHQYLNHEQKKRVVFAISQADKIEPIRGQGSWDDEVKRPGAKQMANLDRKRDLVASYFGQESNLIIDFSSNESYNLDKLLERIVNVLPSERIPLVVKIAQEVDEKTGRETVSSTVEETAKNSFWGTVVHVLKEVGVYPIVQGIISVGTGIVQGIKSLFKLL